MKSKVKWAASIALSLFMCLPLNAYSNEEFIHFSTGVQEGGELLLLGINFAPYETVKIEITDPQEGKLSYIDSADSNGEITITLIATIAGEYKATAMSDSNSVVLSDATTVVSLGE